MNNLEQIGKMKVKEIMTQRVVALAPDDTIQEAANILLENRLATLPVVNYDNKCVGMISGKDLTELFLEEDSELSRLFDTDRLSLEWFHQSLDTSDVRKVKEFMTQNVSQVDPETSIPDVCREMVRNRVHHLPVVDKSGVLQGIISTFDVVDAIANTPVGT